MSIKKIKICLRAFKIGDNSSALNNNKSIFELIKVALKEQYSVVNSRRMRLSSEDIEKDEDVLTYFKINDNQKIIRGTIIRISTSENIPIIGEELFNKNIISMEELDMIGDNKVYYKEHYHFILNDNFIITNLKHPNTITKFQTYINFLLNYSYFTFAPLIKSINNSLGLNQLKEIKITDPFNDNKENINGNNITKRINVADNIIDILKKIVCDVKSLDDIDITQVIKAELLLKISKPRKMTQDDYQKYFGAILKPIGDMENISFKGKDGNKLKGRDILQEKKIDIETTDTEKPIEEQIFQNMEQFFEEIKNE
jgi:hypothetical protein